MSYRTRQREAIWRAIEESGRPLTAIEVMESAAKEVPRLGIATVYRALRNLVDDGEVRQLEVPGTTPHYEPSQLKHHHHFVCEKCNRVFDLQGCPGGIGKLVPPGYRADRHEIVIYGSCADCPES